MLYVSGVGHDVAVCDKSLHCKVARKGTGGPARAPAVLRLDTYSANVAEGSGGNLLSILGLSSMSNMKTIRILEQGLDEMIILGSDLYRLPRGKGQSI
eukprot:9482462-Pyramimonas_sp.AAC.1